MNKLYDCVDYNNLKFEYMTKAKDVTFYEYRDSKELLNAIRDGKIGFSEALNKQDEFLSKLTNIKIGKKTLGQKEVINNIERFYISRQEVFNFFRDFTEMLPDAHYKAKQNETKGIGLKYLHPSKCFKYCL